MKTRQKSLRADRSGQLLIVAALAIGLIISSTTVYVYELSKATNTSDATPMEGFFTVLRQSTRNAMLSSLVNVSNGGVKQVLSDNLDRISGILRNQSLSTLPQLTFSLRNDSNYDWGVWLSWGMTGLGVSSVYADFALTIYGSSARMSDSYAANVTTAVLLSGSYAALTGNDKNVTLVCTLLNEGEPALAGNLTFYYESAGSWVQADESNSLNVVDYGNGTYVASFIVSVSSRTVNVSTRAYDTRQVFVRANATCIEG